MELVQSQNLSPEDFKKQFPQLVNQIRDRLKADEIRKNWLKQRLGHFTASEIYKFFTKGLAVSSGQMPINYMNEVVAEIFGAQRDEIKVRSMWWGDDHEVEAVKNFMKRYKRKVTHYGLDQKFVHWGERCGGTPDGLIGKTICIQVKCPENPGNHTKHLRLNNQGDLKKKLPEYYIQMQSELLFTNRKTCLFISYDPRFEFDWQFKVMKIVPDKIFQPVLIERLQMAEREAEEIVYEICGKKISKN